MCTCARAQLAIDRSVDRLAHAHFLAWLGRPSIERQLSVLGAVNRAIDRQPNGQKIDRWPVDLAVDQQASLAWILLLMASFYLGHLKGFLEPVLVKIFNKFSRAILATFWRVFKQFFGAKILYLYLLLKFWKIKENKVLGILVLFFNFFIYQEVFPKSFLYVSFLKTLYTHILELFIVKSIL